MLSLRFMEWPKQTWAAIADNARVVCHQYGMSRYDFIRDEWFEYYAFADDVTTGDWCETHGSKLPCSKCAETAPSAYKG
jgi:hypothetical protein